jgi:hypothetical protein
VSVCGRTSSLLSLSSFISLGAREGCLCAASSCAGSAFTASLRGDVERVGDAGSEGGREEGWRGEEGGIFSSSAGEGREGEEGGRVGGVAEGGVLGACSEMCAAGY